MKADYNKGYPDPKGLEAVRMLPLPFFKKRDSSASFSSLNNGKQYREIYTSIVICFQNKISYNPFMHQDLKLEIVICFQNNIDYNRSGGFDLNNPIVICFQNNIDYNSCSKLMFMSYIVICF